MGDGPQVGAGTAGQHAGRRHGGQREKCSSFHGWCNGVVRYSAKPHECRVKRSTNAAR
ncbi:uncharacterized protein BCN122_I1507 [Burkholderia cenocepacia]|nr:uncharacterized protein BCN122_I1507 [Burkholderia cenocepacia]